MDTSVIALLSLLVFAIIILLYIIIIYIKENKRLKTELRLQYEMIFYFKKLIEVYKENENLRKSKLNHIYDIRQWLRNSPLN